MDIGSSGSLDERYARRVVAVCGWLLRCNTCASVSPVWTRTRPARHHRDLRVRQPSEASALLFELGPLTLIDAVPQPASVAAIPHHKPMTALGSGQSMVGTRGSKFLARYERRCITCRCVRRRLTWLIAPYSQRTCPSETMPRWPRWPRGHPHLVRVPRLQSCTSLRVSSARAYWLHVLIASAPVTGDDASESSSDSGEDDDDEGGAGGGDQASKRG